MALTLRSASRKVWELLTPFDEGQQRQEVSMLRRAQAPLRQTPARYGVLSRPGATDRFISQTRNTQSDNFNSGFGALKEALTKPSLYENRGVNVGDFKGSGLIEDFINSPIEQTRGLVNIGQGNYRRGLGEVITGTLEGPGGLIPIAKTAQAAKGAGLATRALAGAKAGIIEGGVSGGLYGGGQAASQDASAGDIAKSAGLSGAMGAGAGGLLGGGLPVAGAVARRTATALNNPIPLNQTGAIGKNVNKSKPPIKQAVSGLDKADSGLVPDVPTVSPIKVNADDPFGNATLRGRFRNEFGKLFIDEDSEMLTMLRKMDKQDGGNRAQEWLFLSDTQRASPSIANAKMRHSPEFNEAFQGLTRKQAQEFDDFLAARAELKNYEGLPTSRTKEQLQAVHDQLAPQYEKRFQALNADNKRWTQDLYDSGIIGKDKYDQWMADDDYIRIQRERDDLLGFSSPGSRSRSFGSTSTTQKRTGSQRNVASPSKTAVGRRQQLQQEIQRNKTASETIGILQEAGLARKVDAGTNKNTIERFVDGKKEFWEVPQDVARVVKNVAPYQLGVIAKIVSAPARVFRAGTTALSAPFTVTNYLRDQASSALYSRNVLATHAPKNIASGLWQASKDFGTLGNKNDDLWKRFTEFAGDQTIYDELRNSKSTTKFLREVRRGGGGKAYNMVISPVRTLEDLNSITERATRYQNFKGTYKSVLKKTGDEEKAIRAAVEAAYQNSVNFQRSGTVTKVLNLLIPYFNAGVQGSRNVARSFRDRPLATSIKSAGLIAAPSMAITTYNLADPDRAEVYNSIPEYEKRDNFIVILPGAKQRSDGRWEGILKVPKAQGYRELTDPSREIMEAWAGGEPIDNVANIAKDMISGLTGPIEIEDTSKFLASVTPQFGKPYIQQQANKDFYTGGQIVPDFMTEGTDDPTKRAYKGTSGTARWIAERLGVEPVRVEKYVEDTFGSLGRYGLNTSDNVVKKVTGNEDFVVGGRSVKSDFSRRLFEAQGELLEKNKSAGRKYYDSRENNLSDVGLNKNEKEAYSVLHPDKTNFLGEEIFDENKRLSKYTKAGIYLQYPKTFEVDKRVDADMRAQGKPGNPLFDLRGEQLNKVLLKQALPPGASDPELDNLWKEEWYQDYQNKNTSYYSAVEKSMLEEGKVMPKSANPYPKPSKDLQAAMDTYSAIPKGTGARSAWISANPELWNRMTSQWAAVDAWENKERVKIGLKELTDEDKGYGSGSGFGGGGGKKSMGSAYKYAVSLQAGGESVRPTIKTKKPSRAKVSAKSAKRPKVKVTKSKV